MKKNSLYIYITAYLALLIPTPGRFVFGLTVLLELLLLVIVGTLTSSLIKELKLEEINTLVMMSVLVAFTILYRQIFVIIYPEIALVLGIIFYLPTASLFLLNNIFDKTDKTLLVRLKRNILKTSVFSLIGIVFFLFRDIAGYGTITFFGQKHHIYEKVLIDSNKIDLFSFFASIPGALILAGLILFVYILFIKKFNILKNAEQQ